MDFTEDLLRQLKTKKLAQSVCWKPEVDSTNTWAKQAGREALLRGDDSLDGALFAAGCQTGGKGRFGRVWTSPAGENLYMTLLLLRPGVKPENASQLTLVMGLAVAQVANEILEASGCSRRAGIKWPNDVVVSGRKICGILTEMQIKEEKAEAILIGVGMNVNQKEFPPELLDKATSLSLQIGEKQSLTRTAARTLEYFEKDYEQFCETQDLSRLREDYERLLLNKDQQVRIQEKDREYCAVAKGITDTGELLVEEETGTVRKIFSGEVSVRGLYSYV